MIPRAYVAHIKNQYPVSRVDVGSAHVSVFGAKNELLLALVIDGNGAVKDMQDELGARDAFSLAPIPKQCRQWKLFENKNGTQRVGKAEEFSERSLLAAGMAMEHNGRVPSMEQLAIESGADPLRLTAADAKDFCCRTHLRKKWAQKISLQPTPEEVKAQEEKRERERIAFEAQEAEAAKKREEAAKEAAAFDAEMAARLQDADAEVVAE